MRAHGHASLCLCVREQEKNRKGMTHARLEEERVEEGGNASSGQLPKVGMEQKVDFAKCHTIMQQKT